MLPLNIKGNKIFSFKNRELDITQPVRIYRNLSRRDIDGNKVYSIKQKGQVVGYATHLTLVNTKFIVSEKTRQKILATGKKVVHAYIEGIITDKGTMGTDSLERSSRTKPLPVKIRYNPRHNKQFVSTHGTELSGALAVIINEEGITAAYTH